MLEAIRRLLARVQIRRGIRAPEVVLTAWDKALLAAEVEKRPGEYRTCSACGSGPWHRTWMWDGICPNCSGAD